MILYKDQTTFQRHEEKYLLSGSQYATLMARLQNYIRPDRFSKSTVCNLYYDTPDFRLIRTSLEKPVYKEKLRLRSYGVPNKDGRVFLELKKKYQGVVYKRRIALTLAEADRYLTLGIRSEKKDQIFNEIDWFRSFYGGLSPVVFLAYQREAYVSREQEALRFTFDTEIRWRREDLLLERGPAGAPLLADGQHLLELKVPGAIPIRLTRLLCELGAYQCSYSKYGAVYQEQILPKLLKKGGTVCA